LRKLRWQELGFVGRQQAHHLPRRNYPSALPKALNAVRTEPS
jgi:hypothetical protein